jgi:hypothetical protein
MRGRSTRTIERVDGSFYERDDEASGLDQLEPACIDPPERIV